ncbi:MAG UNVERIFIED_CONTAM: hypothetical protein LVR18_48090 [Planctomycetaceae bacterium]|jgi:hypothetical protein
MSSSGGFRIFRILGGMLIVFGLVDFGLYQFAGYDLTGVQWSPIAAGIAGSVLMRIGE